MLIRLRGGVNSLFELIGVTWDLLGKEGAMLGAGRGGCVFDYPALRQYGVRGSLRAPGGARLLFGAWSRRHGAFCGMEQRQLVRLIT